MKTMAVAALAAVLAVARAAAADGSDKPADDRAARATGDTLLTTMRSNARTARAVLDQARARKQPDEIRCSDEALSRADVALRRGREDVDEMLAARAANDIPTAATAFRRLQNRAAASRDAASTAARCIPQPTAHGPDRTQVTVHIDPKLPPIG